jgi:hypothetical protein
VTPRAWQTSPVVRHKAAPHYDTAAHITLDRCKVLEHVILNKQRSAWHTDGGTISSASERVALAEGEFCIASVTSLQRSTTLTYF